MKANRFLFLAPLLALTCGWASAQTSFPLPEAPKPPDADVPQQTQRSAAAATTTSDPAKIAELQSRYKQGEELEKEGKLTEALAIFDGIIADAPDAKASLREAGFICVRLNQLPKASDYFEKLHALVPDYPTAIEALIQINQTLQRDVKVELLLKEFRALYASGKVPNPYFVRERIHLDAGDEIVMTEYFDYSKEPYTMWMAELFDSAGNRKRWLLLNYDPDATDAARAKDPKLAQAQVFTLYEHVLKEGQVKQINAYHQYIGLPDYQKTRTVMLAALANPPKPIYSAPVP